jgi:DNA-binding response OmpR family regulator
MRVLIVDDNEITLMVLEEALRTAGYEVEIAHNGQEALDVLQKGSCRMVVSDWEMPQMSGVELCRHIRSDCLRSYVYIIIPLTSRSKSEERVQGLRAGADDFVSKPFDNAELIARIGAGERVLSPETATSPSSQWPNSLRAATPKPVCTWSASEVIPASWRSI